MQPSGVPIPSVMDSSYTLSLNCIFPTVPGRQQFPFYFCTIRKFISGILNQKNLNNRSYVLLQFTKLQKFTCMTNLERNQKALKCNYRTYLQVHICIIIHGDRSCNHADWLIMTPVQEYWEYLPLSNCTDADIIATASKLGGYCTVNDRNKRCIFSTEPMSAWLKSWRGCVTCTPRMPKKKKAQQMRMMCSNQSFHSQRQFQG